MQITNCAQLKEPPYFADSSWIVNYAIKYKTFEILTLNSEEDLSQLQCEEILLNSPNLDAVLISTEFFFIDDSNSAPGG